MSTRSPKRRLLLGKWAFVLGATMATAFAALTVPADAASVCRSGSFSTVASSSVVRVRLGRRDDYGLRTAVACLRSGEVEYLGGVIGPHVISLRGRRIAYSRIQDPAGVEGDPGTLIVTGNLPFDGEGDNDPDRVYVPALSPPSTSSNENVRRVVLAPDGAIAWTTCVPTSYSFSRCAPGRARRVFGAAAPNFSTRAPRSLVMSTRLLDASTRIDPDDLRLSPSGRYLGWTKGGKGKSAALPRR